MKKISLSAMRIFVILAIGAAGIGMGGLPAFGQTVAALTITPPVLPHAVVGTPYAQTMSVATTEQGPFYWSVNAGHLPSGLILNTASVGNVTQYTGTNIPLSGTPTQAGTYTFTLAVTNMTIASTQTYTMVVDQPASNTRLSTPATTIVVTAPPASAPAVTAAPPSVTATTNTASTVTTASLEAQLNALAAQLRELQIALRQSTFGIAAATTPGLPNTGIVEGASTAVFSRDLTLGSRGSDVLALEQYLNENGFTIVSSGPGSPGNETEFFGMRTRLALIRWQKARGISPANGILGPSSRALIESESVGTSGAAGTGTIPAAGASTTATTTTTTTPTTTAPTTSSPTPNNTPFFPPANAQPATTNTNNVNASSPSGGFPPSPSAATASPNSSY